MEIHLFEDVGRQEPHDISNDATAEETDTEVYYCCDCVPRANIISNVLGGSFEENNSDRVI